MYKWVYDRMVKEYKKESKEELAQRILAMEKIECNDRCFANQCYAGTVIYNINELFDALEDLQFGFLTTEKATKVYELAQVAKNDWDYIKHGLLKINNDRRSSEMLNIFKMRVNSAKDEMDSI